MTTATIDRQEIAKGSIPDGYFGDRADVNFLFDHKTGLTIVRWSSGSFTSAMPTAVDCAEALWLLRNHPHAKRYYRLA